MPAVIYKADPEKRQSKEFIAVVAKMRESVGKSAAAAETERRRMRKAVEAMRRKRRE